VGDNVVPAARPELSDSVVGGIFGAQAARTSAGWQPPTPEELQKRLPQYQIIALLGRGGMGAVYKGWQRSLERLVAIKILPPGLVSGDVDFAARFKREAKAMAKLKHAGIIPVHDAGETADGLLYFVMDFVDGTDVQKLLAARGKLPPEEALPITTSVLEALAYAHQRGIIHRDIKPANIMIDEEGRVLVADFGLARSTAPDSTMLTVSNVSMGTPDFMAPEAHLGMDHVDHRADLYAAGVMLYQMLTGKLPRGRFDPPSRAVPGLDKRLDGIIDRTLQNERDARYANAIEMRSALDPVLTRTLAKRIVEPRRVKSFTRRLLFFSFAALIVLGAAVAGWSVLRRAQPTARASTQPVGPKLPTPSPPWKPAYGKSLEQIVDAAGTRTFREGWLTVRGGPPAIPLPTSRGQARLRLGWLETTKAVKLGVSGTEIELVIKASGEAALRRATPTGFEPNHPQLRLPSPPEPGFEAEMRIAWIGDQVYGWVNEVAVGQLHMLPGARTPHGVWYSNDRPNEQVRIRDYEIAALDGFSETEARKLVGIDEALPSMGHRYPQVSASGLIGYPTGVWTRLWPAEVEASRYAQRDGEWGRLNEVIANQGNAPKRVPMLNIGLRARFRGQRIKPDVYPQMNLRSQENDSVNLFIDSVGQKLRLRNALKAGIANLADAPLREPLVAGKEYLMEFYALGTTLVGRVNGQTVTAQTTSPLLPGHPALNQGHNDFVRDVELLNLDGVPEAEARKLIGIERP
jgi:serine/threonine protein kinase